MYKHIFPLKMIYHLKWFIIFYNTNLYVYRYISLYNFFIASTQRANSQLLYLQTKSTHFRKRICS